MGAEALGINKRKKIIKRQIFINDGDRAYLIYERKLTESGLSRWVPLCSSDDFVLNDENITILRKNILSISIDGIKLPKDIAEMWLMYNGKMVRHYTENRKHRLHWVKLTYSDEFKKGDKLNDTEILIDIISYINDTFRLLVD